MANIKGPASRAAALHRRAAATTAAAATILDDTRPVPADQRRQYELADRLRRAAEALAPGWAGAALDSLTPDVPPCDEVPPFVRVGTAAPLDDARFPALVPLPGTGHLVIDTDVSDPRVAGLLRAVLLRLLAASPAGSLLVRAVDGATGTPPHVSATAPTGTPPRVSATASTAATADTPATGTPGVTSDPPAEGRPGPTADPRVTGGPGPTADGAADDGPRHPPSPPTAVPGRQRGPKETAPRSLPARPVAVPEHRVAPVASRRQSAPAARERSRSGPARPSPGSPRSPTPVCCRHPPRIPPACGRCSARPSSGWPLALPGNAGTTAPCCW
ncbi:hypothetical protein JD81_00182 [Micromonospora sagamiensis]|uniref:Uncharacterized protein n=1 Tax=Micromonospora sagamiensis TaxID=47875 RepID=A0A562W8V9_9ACTN|nr:hypothetical protein JD81_00182 [Micromonospora sagamiensis]